MRISLSSGLSITGGGRGKAQAIRAVVFPQIGPLTNGDTLSTAVTWGSYTSGGGLATLRNVATDTRTMDQISASTTQGFFRTHHRARNTITQMRLEFPNWYVQGTEQTPGSNATIYAAVEYPIGATPVRVQFGGVDQGTIPAGGVLLSDPLIIDIPDGAEFAVKSFFESASGIISTVLKGNSAAERWQGGTGALTDQTLTSTNPSTFSTLTYGPSAIVAVSNRPAFIFFGDSRVAGSGEAGGTEYKGEYERTIGPLYAFANASRSGDSVASFVTSNTQRIALANRYFTHILCNYGTNDVVTGSTDATIVANLETVAGLVSGAFYQGTIAPRSSSTDGWTTTVNQTTDASNAKRVSVNASIRAGLTGAAGFLEVADQVETARDSGIWQANFTADGTHATPAGYAAIAASGEVNPIDPITLTTEREMSVNGAAYIAYDGATVVASPDTYRLRETVSNGINTPVAFFSDPQTVAAPALGPNVLTNPDFSTDTVWAKGTGWTISGGRANSVQPNNLGTLTDSTSKTGYLSGETYRVEYTISNYAAGFLTPRFTGGGTDSAPTISANGTYSSDVTLTADRTSFSFLTGGGSGFTGSVDNVSIRQVL